MTDEPSLMTLCAVTLDCTDPLALADFYGEATGLALDPASNEAFAGLVGPDGFFLGFQRVSDYRAPEWPGQRQPQQSHLDFEVDDLDASEAVLLRLGARRPREQPDSAKFRVLTDPAGHPFCLTPVKRVRK